MSTDSQTVDSENIDSIPQKNVVNLVEYMNKKYGGDWYRLCWQSYDTTYNELLKTELFKQLSSIGIVSVSYDKKEFRKFEPSKLNGNRHQAIALALFLSSAENNPIGYEAEIIVPHEQGDNFIADFKRLTPTIVQYVNKNGLIVRFRGNPGIWSQFRTSE